MFGTTTLNDNGFKEVHTLKSELSLAMGKVMKLIPEGRDKSIFKTKVEEAVFFATRAVASKPENHTATIDYPEE